MSKPMESSQKVVMIMLNQHTYLCISNVQ